MGFEWWRSLSCVADAALCCIYVVYTLYKRDDCHAGYRPGNLVGRWLASNTSGPGPGLYTFHCFGFILINIFNKNSSN